MRRRFYRPMAYIQPSVKVDDPSVKGRIEALQNNKAAQDNEWLQNFLSSVLEQFNSKGYLTDSQIGVLERNEAQYDPEKLSQKQAEHNEWLKEFDDRKKDLAKKVAEFYRYQNEVCASPFYYEKTARAILADENFVPSRDQYDKMVNNKHAQRWIEVLETEPLFQVGDYIELRSSTQSYYVGRKYSLEFAELKKYSVGTIIQIKNPTEAVKGSRLYCILPLGGTKMVEVQERFLKKAKGV